MRIPSTPLVSHNEPKPKQEITGGKLPYFERMARRFMRDIVTQRLDCPENRLMCNSVTFFLLISFMP
jgi:hypothetical protein